MGPGRSEIREPRTTGGVVGHTVLWEHRGRRRDLIPLWAGASIMESMDGWGFPGGLAVRLWCFHCRGPGLIPDRGTEIPQAMSHGPKKKKKKKAKKIWVEVDLDEQLSNT